MSGAEEQIAQATAGEAAPNRLSGEDAGRLMRGATYASVAVALTLMVGKSGAWLATDSVAMLGSLIDSLLDAGASLINLWAVRHALAPADVEHRFGHGKAEALAGLAQAAFIAGSALFLMFESIERLIAPRMVEHSGVGVVVLAGAMVLTLGLVVFQAYVVRRTGSIAISSDSLHYRGDLLMNAAVIVALLMTAELGLPIIDAIFGVGIAIYIISGAVMIIRGALDQLMDRELPDEARERIREIAMEHEEVLRAHDLRTRSSGIQTFIQIHLEMDGDMNLQRAHEIADEVEDKIRAAFPGAEVIIHQDPFGLEEPPAMHMH